VVEVSVSESRVGGELQFTGMIRDVTERKQVELQLNRERDLAQVTLASIADGVITTDEAGNVRYLNPVAERLTGWSADAARGQPVTQVLRLLDSETGAPVENPVRAAIGSGSSVRHREHDTLVQRDGQRVCVQHTAAPIRSREGYIIGAVLVLHDVTVALNLARELSHQASHDALTGLPNRREFERRLQSMLDQPATESRTHVLGFLDLDQFKVVNDSCGHVAGDELLRQLSALLKSRVRASDTIARLGGDEFGVLFPNCPIEKARALAEAFRQDVEGFRFGWEGQAFAVGVSIGLVEILGGMRTLGEVLSAADSACYAAKENGRNRVHVWRPDDTRLVEHHGQLQWVTRLQAALDEDRLRLYVQPIVPIVPARGHAIHYEILLRLEEDGRIVGPGSFLPAAERYHLMPRIDQWVVSNTLAWLSDAAREHGRIDGTYCINLSGASLSDERFRDSLRRTLEQRRLPPGAVCFEITETAAVANLSTVVRFIDDVKKLGCTFALDDFGSGLSSFAYLKTLPVDFLKIDGGFVRDIADDPIDYAMVQSINAIGHVMGLKTIAEFVENETILQRLAEIGVDYAQGYHLGRPRPLEDGNGVRLMPR
jgi:Amt family ammonium transporter